MTWRELWLFLHVTAAMVWIGGAVAVQVFGILTKRAADPAKTAFFAGNVSFLVMRVLFPAALVVLLSGIGLKVEGHWDWGEPFIVYGPARISAEARASHLARYRERLLTLESAPALPGVTSADYDERLIRRVPPLLRPSGSPNRSNHIRVRFTSRKLRSE